LTSKKAKYLTLFLGALGVAVALIWLVTARDYFLESWYLRRLRSPRVADQMTAIRVLGDVGAERSMAALAWMAPDDLFLDQGERSQVMGTALDQIIERHRKWVARALVNAFKAGSPEQRAVASRILVRIGRDAVPVLMSFLQEEDCHVRWGAVEALGRLGPDAADAVRALEELRARDLYVRDVAEWALGRILQPPGEG
jgi:hypothetical protein